MDGLTGGMGTATGSSGSGFVDGAENEDEALFSGDEEEQKPRKVRRLRCLDVERKSYC